MSTSANILHKMRERRKKTLKFKLLRFYRKFSSKYRMDRVFVLMVFIVLLMNIFHLNVFVFLRSTLNFLVIVINSTVFLIDSIQGVFNHFL